MRTKFRRRVVKYDIRQLATKAGFEGSIAAARRAGGSLGRNIGRIQSRALPPPPIQESSPDKDKRSTFRGSLSRALGLKSGRSLTTNHYGTTTNHYGTTSNHYGEISSPVHEAVSPTSSECSSTFGSQRPESPQSAIVRRRPTHRHRRVKSIGDIDAITTAVTPV
ncbi:unnamed protein product [Nesidiocoris tenuis]|uniref:Uncharacterized protein n=1 Tax=Nesidiocoris tenuis TaxID=355587 RepID=A0A6H5GLN6_9HEMI|nr:unnamed protein product [Nesidiocoris tenuis]